MRLPKGFGKNYFSLTAITATVNQVTLSATTSRIQNFHMPRSIDSENEEELEELDEILPGEILLNSKPCHCNCHFLKYTRKTLKLYFTQKLFFNYFKSLNNAISPPKFHMPKNNALTKKLLF